jgi:hypothetical protein
MRLRTSMAVAIAGTAAVVGLLAGPAGAQTSGPGTSGGARATNDSVASGTCVATNDSTCSGSGSATNDSTSSGSAVARDGSTASGCALAIDDSTASGGATSVGGATGSAPQPPCPTGGTTPTTVRPGAGPASPTTGRLALTGSTSQDLAVAAFGALAAGGVLVALGRRRPQEG